MFVLKVRNVLRSNITTLDAAHVISPPSQATVVQKPAQTETPRSRSRPWINLAEDLRSL